MTNPTPEPTELERVARTAADLALGSRPDPGPRLDELASALAAQARRLDELAAAPQVPDPGPRLDELASALAAQEHRLERLEEAPQVPDSAAPPALTPDPVTADALRELGIRLAIVEGKN